MLYDPKWQQSADPLTLPNLIGWLKRKPREQEYDYNCNGECLLAQFLRDKIGREIIAGSFTYYAFGENFPEAHAIPDEFNVIARTVPRTFGAALKRARAALRAS